MLDWPKGLFEKHITCRHTCWDHRLFKWQAVYELLLYPWCFPSISADPRLGPLLLLRREISLVILPISGLWRKIHPYCGYFLWDRCSISMDFNSEWFHSCVSSAVSIQPPLKSPMALKVVFDQRWRGRPTIITHVKLGFAFSLIAPIIGFHHWNLMGWCLQCQSPFITCSAATFGASLTGCFSEKICFQRLEDHLLISEKVGVSTALKLPTKLLLRT